MLVLALMIVLPSHAVLKEKNIKTLYRFSDWSLQTTEPN